MERIEDLMEQLAEKEVERDYLQEKVAEWEPDPNDYTEEYEEALNEEGEIEIAGCTFDRAEVLKEMDPIAYDTGLIDYIDAIGSEEDEDYCKLWEALQEAEEEVEELKERLETYEERKAEEDADRWYDEKVERGEM